MIELLLQAERALANGMVDQAERLYRQAAAADPHDSIAVVGLARVALERADEPLAWREAQRALAIDPENVAAQRLARRLEEIYAYRGESLREIAGAGVPMSEPQAASELRAAPESQATPEPRPTPAASAANATKIHPPTAATVSPSSRTVFDRILRRNRP